MVSKIFISNKPNFIPNNWSCYKTIEQFYDEINGITKNNENENDENDCYEYVEKFDDMAQCIAFYECVKMFRKVFNDFLTKVLNHRF